MVRSSLVVWWFCCFSVIYSQENFNLELLSNFDYTPMVSDVWGYVDSSGIEYAIVGVQTGTSIVSLEDPEDPEEVLFIGGATSIWRDIVSWEDYIYVVADQSGTTDGILIIDMTGAPNNIQWKFENPEITINGNTETLNRCHNIWMDEQGYAYLSGCNMNSGGVLIMDMATDPWNPEFLGASAAVYSHDNYTRDGIMYSAEIYVGGFAIYDVSDPEDVILINEQTTSSSFTHNCWLSDDDNYLFTTDEVANAYVDAYDVSDPYDIKFLSSFRPKTNEGEGVIPHNVHYHEGYLVVSWYTDGVIIIDAHDPENLVKVAQYDTYSGSHGGTNGCWGAYPYLPSGLVLASDRQTGLYVLEPTYVRACYLEGNVTSATDGSNINNVEVEILTDFPNGTTTGPDGKYKTGTPDEGTWEVSFSHPDYQDTILEVEFISAEIVVLDLELQPNPCTPPAVQASDFEVLETASGQLEIGWERGSGTQVLVLCKEGGFVDEMPEEGEVYSANSVFGMGDELGNGNFAVYSGTGSSTLVTGLEPDTEYGFAIIEFFIHSVCYLTPPLADLAATDPLQSDLEVVKTSSVSEAYPGDTLTFTLEITNYGPDQNSGVSVTDYLPEELLYLDSDPTGNHDNGVVEWNLGSMGVGQVTVIELEVIVDEDAEEGGVVNSAEVVGDISDPNPANNSDNSEVEILCLPDHECQENIVVYVEEGTCEAQAFFDQEGCSYSSGDYFSEGIHKLSCSFTNSCGDADSCTFNISVLDTIAPEIIHCPVTRTVIACSLDEITGPDYATELSLSTLAEFSDGNNQGEASDNCELGQIQYIDSEGQDCPYEITRIWLVEDESGNETSCEQTIFVNPPALVLACPDILVYNSCLTQTDVDFAFFDWLNDAEWSGGCDPTMHHDHTEPPSNCGGEVTVTFTLSDNCGQELECISTFEVAENTELEVDCPENTVVETAEDDCFFTIDSDSLNPVLQSSCGNAEMSFSVSGAMDTTGTGSLEGLKFPAGVAVVVWTISDLCSEKICSFEIEVVDQQVPGLNCPADTTVVVSLGTDSVFVELEQAQATDNCGVLSVENDYNSGGADASDYFTVDTHVISFTATDSAGNSAECLTTVFVEWEQGSGEFLISGAVEFHDGGSLEDVELILTGDISDTVFTNQAGSYSVIVDEGTDITVTPVKEGDWLDGLSTFDLLLIQSHIIFLDRFDSPYQYIAADANNDGLVNTMDLIYLQKIILGNLTSISGNTPWRFIPEDFTFADPDNPLVENWPDTVAYFNVDENKTGEGWLGIKVGDLNGSVMNSGDRRVVEELKLKVDFERGFAEGERAVIRLAEEALLYGFQMEWQYSVDQLEYKGMDSSLKIPAGSQFFVDEENGTIRFIWFDVFGQTFPEKTDLVSIEFKEKTPGINIADHFTLVHRSGSWYSEAYLSDKRLANLKLVRDDFDAHAGYELHQNRPNPFTQRTYIPFRLPERKEVTLEVFDNSGRVLFKKSLLGRAGWNELKVHLPEAPGGILFYRLSAGDWSAVKKMSQIE